MTDYEDNAGYGYDPTQPVEEHDEQAAYPEDLPRLSTLALLRQFQRLGGHVDILEGGMIFTAIRHDHAGLATALRQREDLADELLLDERLKEAAELAVVGERVKTTWQEYTF